MEMFERDNPELDNNDVISMDAFVSSPLPRPMFRVDELKGAVDHLKLKVFDGAKTWFENGASCQILSSRNGGWRKGKIYLRLSVEFVPDEPTPKP